MNGNRKDLFGGLRDLDPEKLASKILDEYLSGSLSAPAERRVQQWLSDVQNRTVIASALEKEWNRQVRASYHQQEWVHDAYRKLARRLNFPETETGPCLGHPWNRIAARTAAVLIPLLVIAGWFYLRHDNRTEAPQVVAEKVLESGPEETSVSTASGELSSVTLSDGTDILLNENTRLAYTASGEVELSGEAFFRVVPRGDRPMVVRTPDMEVTVLGTEFNLDTDAPGQTAFLDLYQGRVWVAVGGTDYSLSPGYRIQYGRADGKVTIEPLKDGLPAWISDRLSFVKAPLPEVFRTLEWYYDVRIEVEPGVDVAQRYSFEMNGRETLEGILEMMRDVGGEFSYALAADTLTIRR